MNLRALETTLPRVPLELVRSFADEMPELRAAMTRAEPWLEDAIGVLRSALPIPASVQAFVERPFYRPPGSHRSFYYHPGSAVAADSRAARGVLAFKGMEPCASGLDRLLSDLTRPCYSPHSIAEHFVYEEGKIPGALTLAEALEEGERAAEVQCAHLRVYGGLARLPLPLFVFRHAPSVEEAMLARLEAVLSRPAWAKVQPWVRAGLGVHVYHYPSPPVRVRDVDSMLSGKAFQQRMFALLSLCDPELIIERWVREFVRMLYLGFLPGSLASFRTGVCCQVQNACIDGGFVDLDSLTAGKLLRDDTAVFAALQLSTDALLDSVRALVAGSQDAARSEGAEVRVDLQHLRSFLWARVRGAISREARPGVVLDPRVVAYFELDPAFDALISRLSTYYSAPSSGFAATAERFNDFGLSLLAATRSAD